MRTRNALERLTTAGMPLLAQAEALADAAEEGRILERILASPRPDGGPALPRRRAALALVVAAVAVAAVAAYVNGVFASSHSAAPQARGDHHQVALSGAKIQLAGYHFRTPAGFTHSTSACLSAPVPGKPRPAIDGFAAAASADGGCLEAAYLIADQPLQGPADAQPVAVGQYHGYFVPQTQGPTGQSSLFVDLPKAGDDHHSVSLLLLAQGLTEDQLIAVAESGLPTLPPPGPTMTTGTETTG